MGNQTNLKEALYAYLDSAQFAHLGYALKKLGFHNESLKNDYLDKLYQKVYEKLREYKSLETIAWIVYSNIREEFVFKKASFVDESEGVDVITKYVINEIDAGYITATDISSYVFCPASYCIKKSFIDDEATIEAQIGTGFHEYSRLVYYTDASKRSLVFGGNVIGDQYYNKDNHYFFDDLRKSKIVYAGYDANSKKYFKSSKANFFGSPNYIFANENGQNYVVQEKFRNAKKRSNILRSSHKAQVVSYINFLDSIDALYGYIVYWYYVGEDDSKRIKECIVFKVEKSETDEEEIQSVFQDVSWINEGFDLEFDRDKLDAKKCVNCVVNRFCGHKTGRFTQVSIPYGKEYYGLI
ncbi:hypothetical protein MON38_18470 [Hymenobacter sp. DH14]|uniref:PD-(D/E)XK endonuclease-like domain-containing protein n=1 Tax=Hymenobacter cyanobacteriorum TaxID=2926463 RepID=A0A9X2AHZ1_9BACT|nr:hypothetical protein [Hymenobacter cyanobacteriorum]MCI1189413.1 hypothetical protein [Hymenobacter cyanobacteriorum]